MNRLDGTATLDRQTEGRGRVRGIADDPCGADEGASAVAVRRRRLRPLSGVLRSRAGGDHSVLLRRPHVGPGTNTFTDPAFFAAAGVNAFTGRHVAVRPAVGAIIAVRNGQSYTVGTLAVRVEYHFEEHPVSPN
jgi:hypothetical protein